MNKWGVLVSLVLLSSSAWAQTIRIGVLGPMAYLQGRHTWYGATLAAEEINRAGGIQLNRRSYRIELVRVDTNEMVSVPDAATAVERAIVAQRIDFLIGGFRSEAVLAMTEVAAEYRKIFLTTGSAAVGLTAGRVDQNYGRYKYIFRVSPYKATDIIQTTLLQLGEVIQTLRQQLNIPQPKVALLVERVLAWDPVIEPASRIISAPPPQGYGAEVVGVWRPSAVATDLTSELTAIQRAGAQVIFTLLSGPAGTAFGREWGRLKIPAATVGANVDAQQGTWLEATSNLGNYVATINFIAPDIAITPKTIPFVVNFRTRFREIPIYTASGTYDALYILADALKRANSLEADAVIEALETTDYVGVGGRYVFDKLHDVKWGPGYVTGIGVQWVDGRMVTFWPRNWRVGNQLVGYAGTRPYQLPPWVVEAWRR